MKDCVEGMNTRGVCSSCPEEVGSLGCRRLPSLWQAKGREPQLFALPKRDPRFQHQQRSP